MNGIEDLHPRRSDGSSVNATFEVASIPVYEIVYHHKAGGRGSPRSVNADYHEGLELLLERLASIGCTILGVSLDSSVAWKLAPADRELALDFPLSVGRNTDPHAIRLLITRAQKSVARRPDAKPGGGNDQKRIRMTVALDRSVDPDELKRLLVG